MQKVSDFKGKNIGIVSLASGGLPLLRSLLKANGLDPDKDVNIIATGAGAPALEALKSNRVQGLMFWNAAIAGFENAGAKLRLFRSPEWQRLPDFSLATTQRAIERDPAMVEASCVGQPRPACLPSPTPSACESSTGRASPRASRPGPMTPRSHAGTTICCVPRCSR